MAADPLAPVADNHFSVNGLTARTTTALQAAGRCRDNPDQRHHDDVKLFVDQTLNIGVGLEFHCDAGGLFAFLGLSADSPLTIFNQNSRFRDIWSGAR